MAVIIVSNCLLGCTCRYKGDDCRNDAILALAKDHTLIGVCPEQMGGLPTPRDPAEIVGDRLITNRGNDVTEQYLRGADAAWHLGRLNGADFAILKYRSPACGVGLIYDGTFRGNLIPGNGVFAALLQRHGSPTFSENDVAEGTPELMALLNA